MCLLPVFFMVSDLRGRVSGGKSSFWEERRVSGFSQCENYS